MGLQKREIRQKWPKMNQKWISTLKQYEIVLNLNDWISNFLDKSAQYCKIG